MKKLYSLIFIFSVFLIGCDFKDSVTNAIIEKPVTGTLTAVYDESNTSKSISVGDTLDSYTGNFELTCNDGTTSSSITVTKDMISLDTSSIGEKVATISYNGSSTTVSAIVCTKASDFTRSSNTITAYTGSASSVVVPRYIDSTEITTLGNAVFKEKTTLTSVIANNIITIADGYENSSSDYSSTFWGDSNLNSISFPKVTSIGIGAFILNTSLSSVSFPNATSIGEAAFHSNTSLTSASFPLVTSIGNSAFEKCTSLTSITFGTTTPPTLGIEVFCFSGTSKSWTINVPSGTSSAYSTVFSSATDTFSNTSTPTYAEY